MAVHSLELANDSCDDDGHPKRTGTLWSCVAHIITAVIGSGVLALAWSIAQLGWIAGPICLLCFAIVTYISASLLSDCYRSPDSVTGKRNYCYMDAVSVNLGKKRTWICGLLQNISFYGTAIAYVITTSTCMGAILKSNCYHMKGHKAPCAYGHRLFMLLFGILQIVMSLIPAVLSMAWLSVAAAIMSFYFCCGCFGYAAFGNVAPGNLLTGFGFYEPYWLVDFANACIIVHLVGGYQIYSQPIFAVVERWFAEKFPGSEFVNKFHTFKLPMLPACQVNFFRLCFRTVYVVSTTAIALIFPYFNQVLGVLGAIKFWPLAVYFAVEMYFVQKQIGAWARKWIVLRIFSFFCLLVSLVALVGSVKGLISARFG